MGFYGFYGTSESIRCPLVVGTLEDGGHPNGIKRTKTQTMGQTQQTENTEEIDVKALQDMYKKFVTECPSGLLFLHEFKRFFGVDPTGEASDYAENMFRAFDTNGVRSF